MRPGRLFLIPELFLLCRIIGAAGLFAVSWLRSRQLLRLVMAVPVIFTGALFCWSVLLARTETRNADLLVHYLQWARRASVQNDLQTAHLSFRRAQQLSHSDPKVTFEYAETVFKAGSLSEALQMMSGLAPTDKTGYLPAHRFLAANATFDDPVKADLFRAVHLGHVIRADVNGRQERLWLLDILARYRRFDRADALLRQTLDQYPEDRLTLARMKAKTGDISAAREEAQLAVGHLQLQVQMSPNDSTRRIQLAQGHVFLGQFPKALTVLIDGLTSGQSQSLTNAICLTYERWYSVLDPVQQKSQRLCLNRLFPEVSVTSDLVETDSQVHLNQFRAAMNDKRRDWFLLVLLGNSSAADGDLLSAENQLRMALMAAPDDPTVRNNLAWVLAQRYHKEQVVTKVQNEDNDPSLDSASNDSVTEAMTLSKAAVESMPEVYEFRETLGQILALRRNDGEAIVELLYCLNHGYHSASIHKTLSQCFQRLGRKSESQFHLQLARP